MLRLTGMSGHDASLTSSASDDVKSGSDTGDVDHTESALRQRLVQVQCSQRCAASLSMMILLTVVFITLSCSADCRGLMSHSSHYRSFRGRCLEAR